MHSKSKGFRRFIGRIECFVEDMEVVDMIYKNMSILEDPNTIFHGVTSTYPHLYRRPSNRATRALVINHLKHTLYVSIIKEMYEELMIYLGYSLNCGALTFDEPDRLVGDQKFTMTANEILSTASREDIVKIVMTNIFRKLENKRDTLLLITAINDRLALELDEDVINRAMPYLEARHIFVHRDGIPDDDFREKYPDIELTEKQQIKLNATIMHHAVIAVRALTTAVEQKMKEHNYFPVEEFQ